MGTLGFSTVCEHFVLVVTFQGKATHCRVNWAHIHHCIRICLVRFAYNEDTNVIMTVTGSASQMRGSEYLPRQAAISWLQTNGSEQEFSVLKNYNEQKQNKLSEYSMGS